MALLLNTQPIINALWGEDITYRRAGNPPAYTFEATRDSLGEAEGVTSYGVYSVRKEEFTFSTTDADFRPKLRDTITLDADVDQIARVVTKVDESSFLGFWDVETAYPALAEDLYQTATVYRANAVSDDLGLREPQPVAIYTDTPCRLQPDSRVMEMDAAARVVTRKNFVCVFSAAVSLNAGDTVEVDSVVYEVTEQSEVESLGVLTFAAVTRID